MNSKLMTILPEGGKEIFSSSIKSINTLDITTFPLKVKNKFGRGDISRECDFNYKNITLSVFGFCDGKAGSENKFDLPPPIDQTLYFGCLIIIAHNNETIIDITEDIFNDFYEQVFEGFVNLGDEDTWSEEEEEDTEDREFIVDDDFVEYEEGCEEEEEEYITDDESTEESSYISLDSDNISDKDTDIVSLDTDNISDKDTNKDLSFKMKINIVNK